MRNAETVLSVIRKRGRQELPLSDVYRQLYNPELFLRAYARIYRNDGAMTEGMTEETVDGMSLAKINSIIEKLRFERYRWTPVRRVYIPKKNGKVRPLGLPSWSDKLLQEVMRSILEAYYDPQFFDQSHGFRPGRGCHTALNHVQNTWTGTKWFIEGDVVGCFDNINHEVLMNILRESIKDNRFLRLVDGLLRAGYCEEWRYHPTPSGTPQGGIVSPILSNIYLNRLDKFVTEILVPKYTRGSKRNLNREYDLLLHRRKRRREAGRWDEAKAMLKQMQTMPSHDPCDPEYRRLKYVRYADDFLLGFDGPRKEAEEIKASLHEFLQDDLRLELSKEKTLISHGRTEPAKFLGYELHTLWNNRHLHRGKRTFGGQVSPRLPASFVDGKCQRFLKKGKTMHRKELLNDSDYGIILRYQQEYRGYVEYYAMARNLHWMNRLHWIMRDSLLKTLANKHKSTKAKMARKYSTTITTPNGPRKCLQVTVPREGKTSLIARFGGLSLRTRANAILPEPKGTGTHNWVCATELVQRLLADQCEICRSRQNVEVHHVRKLADLSKPGRKDKPLHVRIMAARRRKTLVLCRACHDKVHAGLPLSCRNASE